MSTEAVAMLYSNCKAVMFLSPGFPRADTLITVLSRTKIGNRLHNNRCVSFHSCDLLPDIGHVTNVAGFRSA